MGMLTYDGVNTSGQGGARTLHPAAGDPRSVAHD